MPGPRIKTVFRDEKFLGTRWSFFIRSDGSAFWRFNHYGRGDMLYLDSSRNSKSEIMIPHEYKEDPKDNPSSGFIDASQNPK